MTPNQFGIIHPGEMGISVAASAQRNGHEVYWASDGRSQQTRERALKFKLQDAGTIAQLCAVCSTIICVCPPENAETVARQVAASGFKGLYLDANATSPQRTQRIGQVLAQAGVDFVDGGIIGGPAWKPKSTWLYLSGPHASQVAECFAAGPLETRVIGESIGSASALKMCYSAYNKGTMALLSATLATAETLGVRAELEQQWANDRLELAEQADQRVRRVTAKAWRFAGEMDEIAATFADAGLPPEFHAAAAILFRRIAHFKNAPTLPPLGDVLIALARAGETKSH